MKEAKDKEVLFPLVIRCWQKVRLLSLGRESISPILRIGAKSDFLTQVSQRFMNRLAQPTLWEFHNPAHFPSWPRPWLPSGLWPSGLPA